MSVILVSWNAAGVICPCLTSLEGQGHEVIVVDNASSDGTARLVAEKFPWVRLIALPRNLGFAGGVNAGIRASRGHRVLLLNCDTTASRGAIDRLVEVIDGTPGCVAAGGCLVGPDGQPQHGFHVRRFPTLATWLVDLWLVDKVWPGNPVTKRYLALDQTVGATEPVDVDQPAAACLMVRRDALERAGGLDEQFFPAWFEDVDLCRRLKAAGGRILFVPDARFGHRGGEAMRALGLAPFTLAWYRNLQRYVRKRHGRLAVLGVKAAIVVGMVLRAGVTVLGGRWTEARAYAKVGLDVFATWP